MARPPPGRAWTRWRVPTLPCAPPASCPTSSLSRATLARSPPGLTQSKPLFSRGPPGAEELVAPARTPAARAPPAPRPRPAPAHRDRLALGARAGGEQLPQVASGARSMRRSLRKMLRPGEKEPRDFVCLGVEDHKDNSNDFKVPGRARSQVRARVGSS